MGLMNNGDYWDKKKKIPKPDMGIGDLPQKGFSWNESILSE